MEAKAPARWKTLQVLIQPLTCSLSCVCLNVNSDCVRPRVKRTAVTPRFCPHRLIPVLHSGGWPQEWKLFHFRWRLVWSKLFCSSFVFEYVPVTSDGILVWEVNDLWTNPTFFPQTVSPIAWCFHDIRLKTELGGKGLTPPGKVLHFCSNLWARKMWRTEAFHLCRWMLMLLNFPATNDLREI